MSDVPSVYGPASRIVDSVLSVVRGAGGLRLEPAAILDAAAAVTGLPDRDPGEITQPLQRICADLREHPPTDLGAAIVMATLVQAMVTRRRAQHVLELAPQHPERAPFVLVGWYRTGTTYLQELLAGLPNYGFVPFYRLAEPLPSVLGSGGDPGLLRPISTLWTRVRAELGAASMSWLSPELDDMHPVTATGAEECWLLMLTHLMTDGVAFHWHAPSWDAWLGEADRSLAYIAWARLTSHLEHELGHGLVLKDPAHLLGLGALHRAVPSARLVWTHRDPCRAIASFCSLHAMQQRLVYGSYDAREVGRNTLNRAERYFREGLRARAELPAGSIVDVRQEELRRDPVGCVERICGHFGARFDRAAVQRRADALRTETSPRRTELRDWGLREADVRERLGFYDASWWTCE